MDAATWDTVTRLVNWLDTNSPTPPETNRVLRVLKLSEEVGEVAEAVIGATNHNPRKRAGHTWEDVESEVCDVILTAMVALRTLTPEAGKRFAAHLQHVADRSLR